MGNVAWVVGTALAGTAAITLVDHWTGPELAFSLFYAGPVAYAAWLGGMRAALSVAVVATLAWFWIDLSDDKYSHEMVVYWNALVRGGTFLLIAWLVARVRALLHEKTQLAEFDNLTGLANARGFTHALSEEIARSRRSGRPFSLAYVDLDNFKLVNDRLGHLAGDELLRSAAQLFRTRLRHTDVAARLGGDEFALLLTESAPDGAQHIVGELHRALQAQLSWLKLDVGASIGLVCFLSPPLSVEEAIHLADVQMYEVKRSGKHAVGFSTYGERPPSKRPPEGDS